MIMAERRPSVFIGSSSEGHGIAEAIQLNLDRACEVVIWSQGIFGLGGGTLETLVDKADEFDFAILVVTPDDMTRSRGKDQASPRDNVLLELGLFIGKIGRNRTFIVFDRTAKIKMPSDLAGVTLADYQPHSSGNLQPALGAASTKIKSAIQEHGPRERDRIGFNVDQTTQFQIIADLMDQSAHQFIILMHEQNVMLHKESMFGRGIRYQYLNRNRSAGDGSFSVSGLCKKLPDAGLLQKDLRENVSLTGRGHEFAAWLVERGHKADHFKSEAGSWGGDPPPPGFSSFGSP
jgi:hypothetical protein